MYDFQVGEVPFDLNGLGGNSCHGLGLSKKQLSNEKNPGCLGYIGDYTTQVYRDYDKPL